MVNVFSKWTEAINNNGHENNATGLKEFQEHLVKEGKIIALAVGTISDANICVTFSPQKSNGENMYEIYIRNPVLNLKHNIYDHKVLLE
jgi:hypothetical protein